MGKRSLWFLLFFTGLVLLVFLIMQPFSVIEFQKHIAVLLPKGIVAVAERNLLIIIQALMLLVIVPVYVLTFIFSWHFSVHNKKAKYDPDLVDNRIAEYVWWGIPLVMIIIIGVLTVYRTYELDPYKPLASDKKALNVQVVALQWKWLFIYPEEKIATVNFLEIPVDRPIHFEITADAPMNSFWIPHLGGQIYAMPNMRTELNLIANEAGDFRGSSANISGVGFSGMHFITRAAPEKEYQEWVRQAKMSSEMMSDQTYDKLARPSQNDPVGIYQLQDEELFQYVLNKYMQPK